MNKSRIVRLASRTFICRRSVSSGVLLELLADDILHAYWFMGSVGVGCLRVELQSLHGLVFLLIDHVYPVLGQRISIVVLRIRD